VSESKFKFPVLKVGDLVGYRRRRNHEGFCVAMVKEVNAETIAVTVFPNGGIAAMEEGVRHEDDPFLQRVDFQESRCFFELPQTVAIGELIELLPTLRRMCEQYKKSAASKSAVA
jgi:hypothetical protein